MAVHTPIDVVDEVDPAAQDGTAGSVLLDATEEVVDDDDQLEASSGALLPFDSLQSYLS